MLNGPLRRLRRRLSALTASSPLPDGLLNLPFSISSLLCSIDTRSITSSLTILAPYPRNDRCSERDPKSSQKLPEKGGA